MKKLKKYIKEKQLNARESRRERSYNRFLNEISGRRGGGRTYEMAEGSHARTIKSPTFRLSDFEMKVLKEVMKVSYFNPLKMELTGLDFYVCPCCPFTTNLQLTDTETENRLEVSIEYSDIFPSRSSFEATRDYTGKYLFRYQWGKESEI